MITNFPSVLIFTPGYCTLLLSWFISATKIGKDPKDNKGIFSQLIDEMEEFRHFVYWI